MGDTGLGELLSARSFKRPFTAPCAGSEVPLWKATGSKSSLTAHERKLAAIFGDMKEPESIVGCIKNYII